MGHIKKINALLSNAEFGKNALISLLTIIVLFAVSKTFPLISLDPANQWDFHYFYINVLTIKYGGAALFIIFSAFYIFDKRLSGGKYLIFLIPLIIMISGKALALASLMIFLLSCLAMGSFVLVSILPVKGRRVPDVQRLILAAFMGICINGYLVWAAMHFRVNTQAVYYAFFFAEILFFKDLLTPVFAYAFKKFKKLDLSLGQKAILVSAIFTVVYPLVGYYGNDDLVKHLYIPKLVALNGYFDFDPRFIWSLDLSIIPQSSYVSVFLTGGEYAIRLLNYLLFYIAFMFMEVFTRKRFGKAISFFSTLAGISMPFVLWQIGIIFTDSFSFLSSAVLFAFLFEVFEDPRLGNLIIFFVLAAFAFLCKQLAVYIIFPAVFVVCYAVIKDPAAKNDKLWLLKIVLLPLLSFSLVLPFLLHNYELTGNPFFFFYNGIFRSRFFAPENFSDGRWQQPLNWRSLYDLTFRGSNYIENANSSFGISYFVFLLFSPLILFYKKHRKEIIMTIFVFICSVFLWFRFTGPYMRYFVVCMVSGSIIIGLTVNIILDILKNDKRREHVVVGLVAIVFAVNFLCQMRFNYIPDPYPLMEAFTHNYEFSNMRDFQRRIAVFDYASLKYGVDSICLLVDSPALYLANSRVESSLWYDYMNQREILAGANGPQDVYDRIFGAGDFDYIIMPDSLSPEMAVFGSPGFKGLLTREFSSGDYGLYVPKAKVLSGGSILYDLCENFDKAEVIGRRPMKDNAWGSTIAIVKIGRKECIFAVPDSSLSYRLKLPMLKQGESLAFRSSIGYHPASKDYNGSDGVRMQVKITDGAGSKVLFNRYVMTKDRAVDVDIPLDGYSGRSIILSLYTRNDPGKNENGDWPVWFNPRIIHKKG